MAREMCLHLAFPRTVRLQLSAHWPWQRECIRPLCECTISAQHDKIVLHYC